MQIKLTLRVLRASLKLTQEEMAKMCGVATSHYGKIEVGKLRGSKEFWNNVQSKFNLSAEDVWTMQNEY